MDQIDTPLVEDTPDWREFQERQLQLKHFVANCMVEGLHYGRVVGDKPSLLKPGGELLRQFYELEPHVELLEQQMDWGAPDREPIFYFRYRIVLTYKGKIVGDGIGSANSREPKYRYLWMDYVPPGIDEAMCEKRTTQTEVFKWQYDKRETTGKYGKPELYWEAFDGAIEAGTAEEFQKEKPWAKGEYDTAIRAITVRYRVPNPNIADYINTMEKMAQKRAFMQAILMAAGASEFFTLDVEDIDEMGGVKEWRPSRDQFCDRIIPALPNLLKGCASRTEMVMVIGNLFKDKYKVERFDPSLATEAHAWFLELEKDAEVSPDEPVAMEPKEAFLWLVKLATEAATPETTDAIRHTIEQLDLGDEVEPDDLQWVESYDLLLEDVKGAGLELEPPLILRELPEST